MIGAPRHHAMPSPRIIARLLPLLPAFVGLTLLPGRRMERASAPSGIYFTDIRERAGIH